MKARHVKSLQEPPYTYTISLSLNLHHLCWRQTNCHQEQVMAAASRLHIIKTWTCLFLLKQSAHMRGTPDSRGPQLKGSAPI